MGEGKRRAAALLADVTSGRVLTFDRERYVRQQLIICATAGIAADSAPLIGRRGWADLSELERGQAIELAMKVLRGEATERTAPVAFVHAVRELGIATGLMRPQAPEALKVAEAQLLDAVVAKFKRGDR